MQKTPCSHDFPIICRVWLQQKPNAYYTSSIIKQFLQVSLKIIFLSLHYNDNSTSSRPFSLENPGHQQRLEGMADKGCTSLANMTSSLKWQTKQYQLPLNSLRYSLNMVLTKLFHVYMYTHPRDSRLKRKSQYSGSGTLSQISSVVTLCVTMCTNSCIHQTSIIKERLKIAHVWRPWRQLTWNTREYWSSAV